MLDLVVDFDKGFANAHVLEPTCSQEVVAILPFKEEVRTDGVDTIARGADVKIRGSHATQQSHGVAARLRALGVQRKGKQTQRTDQHRRFHVPQFAIAAQAVDGDHSGKWKEEPHSRGAQAVGTAARQERPHTAEQREAQGRVPELDQSLFALTKLIEAEAAEGAAFFGCAAVGGQHGRDRDMCNKKDGKRQSYAGRTQHEDTQALFRDDQKQPNTANQRDPCNVGLGQGKQGHRDDKGALRQAIVRCARKQQRRKEEHRSQQQRRVVVPPEAAGKHGCALERAGHAK